MKARALLSFFLLVCVWTAWAIAPPTGVVTRSGDRSIVLHWDRSPDPNLNFYRVYRSFTPDGTFLTLSNKVIQPSFADFGVTNGQPYYYKVSTISKLNEESVVSDAVSATPKPFTSDNEFLDYVQRTGVDYFWYEANPTNGLVRDRSTAGSPCSIAAVGFGLTAIAVGVERGWLDRAAARQRVLTTLKTFWEGPQGFASAGTIGYKGWFYHFLKMNLAIRDGTTELSSIDTALLLGGVMYSGLFFDSADPDEASIRTLADSIYNRVDWNFMTYQTNVLRMGWLPEGGLLAGSWLGYNEASILYLLAIGAPTNPLPAASWTSWCSTYGFSTKFGPGFVPFPPLFGHQYSQCWVDMRHTADPFMASKGLTYFENSRRATLYQRNYCMTNSARFPWYGSNTWGITACDGPNGYLARGAVPVQADDGTIAPTAPGGSMPFAPEFCLPALRTMYELYRTNLWTGYGFRDAYNLKNSGWWGPDVLGIDQGPIVIMIENYRSGGVWKRFMKSEVIRRGLEKAGFVPLPTMRSDIQFSPAPPGVNLSWGSIAGRTYQVEVSPDLDYWSFPPTAQLTANGATLNWTDPDTSGISTRFYRVFQFGTP